MSDVASEAAQDGRLLGALREGAPDRPLLGAGTAAEVREAAGAQAERLAAAGVRAGSVVALRLPNDDGLVLVLLAALQLGARPLLLDRDTPDAEARRLLALAGGGHLLDGPGPAAPVDGAGGPPPSWPAGILLATSGSTGLPQLVARSEESWADEARRYHLGVGLSPDDRVLLPLPLAHAYPLGWLWAALLAGAAVRVLPPTALSAVAAAMGESSVVVLVPTLARLLARRGGPAGPAQPRLVMVGAGPVDEELEAAFQARFGVGLARNYGSTETGSLAAGPAGLPPGCVGRPLPGVEHEVVGDDGRPVPAGEAGLLRVRTHSVPWREMGDIVREDEAGWLHVVGRRHGSIRQGDRWVSPFVVESALRRSGMVRDVHVHGRPGRRPGEDRIVAEVVPGPAFDRAALLAHARRHLAPHEVPNEVVVQDDLRRGPAGKVAAAVRYRRAGADVLLAAARAYKRSELLFALDRLGLLRALAAPADAGELAAATGVQAGELAVALETAAALGLVVPDTGAPPAGDGLDPAPFLRLEAELSTGLAGRDELCAVLAGGRGRARAFGPEPLPAGLVTAYAAAMHGEAARSRTRLGLRLAGAGGDARVLEVTGGPGRYLAALRTADPAARGAVVQLGPFAGPALPAVRDAVAEAGAADAGAWDVCVVCNAIHGPWPGDDLDWLLGRLRPGGRLLIDDLLLPEAGDGAEIGLDWLTHGGLRWRTLRALEAGLREAGAEVRRILPVGGPLCHLLVAARPVSP